MILKVISRAVRSVFRAARKLVGWETPKTGDPAALLLEKQGSDHDVPVVYGTRTIGVIKVHKHVTDLAGGAQNELLQLICVICEGEIDAIEEVFFDGVSENDPRWRKDKNNPNSAKWFTIHRYLGSDNQAASAPAVAAIPNWTVHHKMSGLAYLYVQIQMDYDQSIWRGEPEIKVRVRGRKVFDPRTNTTAYTENPGLQLYDYLLNNRFSKAFPANRLVLQSFLAAANFADESLTSTVILNGETTTLTHKRFTANHVVDTGNGVFENAQQFLSAMRGSLPIGSGRLRLQIERESTPLFYFSHGRSSQTNHATIVGNIKSSSGSKKDRFNRVGVRFDNAALDFERDEVFYPDAADLMFTQWLAEDNGVLLEKTFQFSTITNKAEALQMARIIALRSRFLLQCSFMASASAIVVEPGDVVAVTDDTRGWAEKPFRVEKVSLKDDGDVELDLIEHQNAIYPWSGTTYAETTSGTNLGDPTRIQAPTDITLLPDPNFLTGGRLSWNAANNAFVRRFKVQVFSAGTLLFTEETSARNLDLPLLPVGSYNILIYAVSTLGTLSPSASVVFDISVPVAPTDITLIATADSITATAVISGVTAGLGTVFNYAYHVGDGTGFTPVPSTTAGTAVFLGLRHSQLHTIYAQTVSALGVSEWISRQITTDSYDGLVDTLKADMTAAVLPSVVADLQSGVLAALPTAAEVDALMQQAIGDPRVEYNRALLRVIEEYGFHATVENLQYAIANESEARAASVLTLNANDRALAQQVMTVKDTADGTAQSLAAMRTAIQGPDTGTSAELILQSWRNELGEMNSRAFLGVTSVSQGVARVNGVLIDGQTNAIEFQTNSIRWLGLDGVPQLYWNAERNALVFAGEIIAGSFYTAISGYRVEISGTGPLPIFFGTGTKSWANANFAVDLNGNVKINQATITNATVSGTLNGVDGLFSGVLDISNGLVRIVLSPNSPVPIWIGNSMVPPGNRTPENASFFVDAQGRTSAPEISFATASGGLTMNGNPQSAWVTQTIQTRSVRGMLMIDCVVDLLEINHAPGVSAAGKLYLDMELLNASNDIVRRGSVLLSEIVTFSNDALDREVTNRSGEQVTLSAVINHTDRAYFATVNYQFRIRLRGTPGGLSYAIFIKSLESRNTL